jgi:hypothetical protein
VWNVEIDQKPPPLDLVHLNLLLYHSPVEHMNLPVRVLGESRIVRDHADGGTLAVQTAQQI